MTTSTTELQAVLFDMDGTLVDSEKLWDVSLADLAAHFGRELPETTRAAMVGTDMAASLRLFHDDLNLDGDPAESQRILEARTKELFREGLVWRPGARELLHDVRTGGLPTALVTATHRHLVDVALGTLGAENFDVLVCGDSDFERPKPHPDPYLMAARLLGVDPARCVAIEDSPTGVAAAEAAGCVVLAIPNAVPVPPGHRRVFRHSLDGLHLDDLRALLRRHAA
jgi:HAD superfamily hydrolase (TIGR01509 family)